jgi:hypothetical protein
MDGHKLSNSISLPNPRFRWFAFVLQILRREPNGDERENVSLFANKSDSIDNTMGFQPHAVRQLNIVTHN